jgi:hypothetical protein
MHSASTKRLQKTSNDTNDLHPGVWYMSLKTFVCANSIPYLVPTSIANTSTAACTQAYAIIVHTHLRAVSCTGLLMPMIPMACGAHTTRLHVRVVSPYTCARCVYAHVRSLLVRYVFVCTLESARDREREGVGEGESAIGRLCVCAWMSTHTHKIQPPAYTHIHTHMHICRCLRACWHTSIYSTHALASNKA